MRLMIISLNTFFETNLQYVNKPLIELKSLLNVKGYSPITTNISYDDVNIQANL